MSETSNIFRKTNTIIYIASCSWARGRGVINLRYVFVYFGDMILKVCGEFFVVYLDVIMVYKEMVLIMKPFSG